MNIILFAGSEEKDAGKRLLDKITADFSYEKIEFFNHLSSFEKRIYGFPKKIDVVVILAASVNQLTRLLQFRDILEGIEILLILPDQDKDTVSKGLSLYPRFITYTDSNFDDVSAVLGKLTIKHIHDDNSRKNFFEESIFGQEN